MFAIKSPLDGKHANLFEKFLEICRPNKNKTNRNKKPVFDADVKNRLPVIVIF